jgi:hypothetical protein
LETNSALPLRLGQLDDLNMLKDLLAMVKEAGGVLIIEKFIMQENYMPNIVHISGGSVGALNLSGVQVVERIDMRIGELLKDPNLETFANALKSLTEAISSNTERLNETQRNDALGQLELLGQQASLPADKRSRPMLSALVNTLANVCAGAGGLAAAWTTWGPPITAFFGV